mmetsp:Transcript_14379/g.23930  ORF Transcript_14379/g.23930 Transcript_14379/m.23930 type:complete len:89 (-) Transcript_14379:740-1006(-)
MEEDFVIKILRKEQEALARQIDSLQGEDLIKCSRKLNALDEALMDRYVVVDRMLLREKEQSLKGPMKKVNLEEMSLFSFLGHWASGAL